MFLLLVLVYVIPFLRKDEVSSGLFIICDEFSKLRMQQIFNAVGP